MPRTRSCTTGLRAATSVGVVVAALSAGACGSGSVPPEDPSRPTSTLPTTGTRRAMAPAPLSPRGGAQAAWTGQQLLVLGGARTDRQVPPCPPAASCTAPPSTRSSDGAAWDPATGAWTHLVDEGAGPEAGGSLARDPGVWSGSQLLTRFQATSVDLAAGSLSTTSIDAGPGLVYATPVWTGDPLVTVPGAYTVPDTSTVPARAPEVVRANTFDPATGAVVSVPWPFGPSGSAETVSTAWTGTEVIAFVDVALPGEQRGTITAAFDPVALTWRRVSDAIAQPFSAAWDGARVQVVTPDGRLVALDPATGQTSSSALPGAERDASGQVTSTVLGELVASPSGRLLLASEDDDGPRLYLLPGPADVQLPGSTADEPLDGWRRLPALPTGVRAQARTVTWAGEQVVVWGGMAPGVEGQDGVNTAEGWVLDPSA